MVVTGPSSQAAYILRFADFAATTPATQGLAYAGIALHGFCYAFFFAAAFLLVDRIAPRDARHSAQTAFGIAILGIGPILAGLYNGWLDVVGGMAPADPAGSSLPALAKAANSLAAWWQGVLGAAGVTITPGTLSWPAVWWTQAAIAAIVFVVIVALMPSRVPDGGE